MTRPSTRFTLEGPRIGKWTRSEVSTVGAYRVFEVERATLHAPDGKALGRPIHTIRCRPWCNVVALTEADEVVLIWQYRYGSEAMSLEIPGGVVDPGEAPLGAAKRELLEETGYAAATFEPLLVVQPNPALQGNECHTFLARGARLSGPTHFDDGEECEVVLVPARDLPALLDGGHVQHALVVVALERFLRTRSDPLGPSTTSAPSALSAV